MNVVFSMQHLFKKVHTEALVSEVAGEYLALQSRLKQSTMKVKFLAQYEVRILMKFSQKTIISFEKTPYVNSHF